MGRQQRYLEAREAAELLGISVATLYSYVSRGLIRSEPGEGSSRSRRYLAEDVEALRTRKEYRREPGRAAETALGYGMPVLDSAITLIDNGRLYYRGYDALYLARERSFEQVAALLWTGSLAAGGLFSTTQPFAAAPPEPLRMGSSDNPIELYQATLALAAVDDLAAHQLTPDAVARTGGRILRLLVQATVGSHQPSGWDGDSIAATLRRMWCPGEFEADALLSAALVLCADHELNVSAFTARCVASAGSSPYAVVIAALAALQGYKHGGHTARAGALLAAAMGGVRQTVADYLRRGDPIPGFGHPLYPGGDPRARLLLDMVAERYVGDATVLRARALCDEVYAILGLRPTVDFALAVAAAAIGAPRQSPLAIFALGRTAGWIAHALEQYALDQLIRPRARYVGPRPE